MKQDLRQTEEYADYMRQIGWQVAKVPDYLYIKKIPLLPWSIAKLQRAKHVDEKLVGRARKKYRIIKLFTEEMVAKKTIWIDLTKSAKQLLAEMKPKTRYNVGIAQKRGVKVKVVTGEEILKTGLFDLVEQNARRLKIFRMPKKWFEAQVKAFGDKCFATLALRYAQGKPELVAGRVFLW